MKKMVFGIALILFGFSAAYISMHADWVILQLVSMLSIFIGLLFSIYGYFDNDKDSDSESNNDKE